MRRIATYSTAVLAVMLVSMFVGCGGKSASAPSPSVKDAETPTVTSETSATRPMSASAMTTQAAPPETSANAVSPPLPPIEGVVVKSGPGDRKVIALTFDLCATPEAPSGYDAPLVQALVDNAVPATFFMGGLWASNHPGEASALARNPRFEIANHGYAHIHPKQATDAEMRSEISRAQTVIEEVTGRQPRVFRFPFDEYDERTIRIAGEAGMKAISADVVTGDPDKNISARRIAEYTVETARGGSIVLMHANGKGVNTAEALPAIIDGLRANGYEFVTVSELLGEPGQVQDP